MPLQTTIVPAGSQARLPLVGTLLLIACLVGECLRAGCQHRIPGTCHAVQLLTCARAGIKPGAIGEGPPSCKGMLCSAPMAHSGVASFPLVGLQNSSQVALSRALRLCQVLTRPLHSASSVERADPLSSGIVPVLPRVLARPNGHRPALVPPSLVSLLLLMDRHRS